MSMVRPRISRSFPHLHTIFPFFSTRTGEAGPRISIARPTFWTAERKTLKMCNFEQTGARCPFKPLTGSLSINRTGMDYQKCGGVMSCLACSLDNQVELSAEMMLHFTGLKNLDKSGVWVSRKVLVCLDCGFARFSVPKTELALLADATPTSERSAMAAD
jgi:hypothetical protein